VHTPLNRRIESLLWHHGIAAMPAPARVGVQALQFLYCVLRDVVAGPLTLHAMGLVYVTILSLVPLLAVSFSVLKAFGFHHQLEPFLQQFLNPLGERGTDLTQRILGFVDNAQGEVLAGIGLLFLFFTAISMAEQVEGSFNQIWRVERPRSLGRRVSEYLSVILVGPVVMVTAMTLIATLRSTALIQELSGSSAGGLNGPLGELAPYGLVCIGFSFVYWFVPNTAVRGSAALTGGLVGGILWAGTGALFAAFVVNAAATISIYATFAIVLTALLWLYLCWLILLVGAQVAFYVQNRDYMRLGYRQPVTGTGQQELAALAVMQCLATRFREGGGSTGIAEITVTTGLPGLALGPVIARLETAGLLVRAANEGLLPKREPGQIPLREIIHAVRHPQAADVAPGVRWPPQVAELDRRMEAGLEASLGEKTLADLVARSGPSEAPDP
jgi:membrane protein